MYEFTNGVHFLCFFVSSHDLMHSRWIHFTLPIQLHAEIIGFPGSDSLKQIRQHISSVVLPGYIVLNWFPSLLFFSRSLWSASNLNLLNPACSSWFPKSALLMIVWFMVVCASVYILLWLWRSGPIAIPPTSLELGLWSSRVSDIYSPLLCPPYDSSLTNDPLSLS